MRRLAISTLTLMAGLTLFGPAVQAQSNDTVPPEVVSDATAKTVGRVDVLQVSGFMRISLRADTTLWPDL